VKRKDIISGAIIEAIVTTAKENFVKRVIQLKKTERKKEGLTMRTWTWRSTRRARSTRSRKCTVYEKRQRRSPDRLRTRWSGDGMRKMVQGTEHEYTLYCRKMGTMGSTPT